MPAVTVSARRTPAWLPMNPTRGGPARKVVNDQTRGRQRDQRTDGDGQEQEAERGGCKAELFSYLWNAGEPTGGDQAGAGEDEVHATGGAAQRRWVVNGGRGHSPEATNSRKT
jgi:hypothetical protein